MSMCLYDKINLIGLSIAIIGMFIAILCFPMSMIFGFGIGYKFFGVGGFIAIFGAWIIISNALIGLATL